MTVPRNGSIQAVTCQNRNEVLSAESENCYTLPLGKDTMAMVGPVGLRLNESPSLTLPLSRQSHRDA